MLGATANARENMVTTSLSLLQRVRSGTETQSWNRFVRLYTPVIYGWVRSRGVPPEDAADTVQEVFRALVRSLPTFEYDKPGGFGRWLRTVTTNKCRDYFRRQAARRSVTNADVTLPDADNVEEFAEAEYRQQLARHALEIMRGEFEFTTWKACWLHVVSGKPAREIATELGISTNAVYVSKSRVLRRLREELDGLWE